MKKFILLFSIFISTIINVQAQEATNFAIKSGYVKYELTGNTTGFREIWWSEYGNKSYTIEKYKSTTKMLGISSTEIVNKHTISNDTDYWEVDYTTMTGIKETNTYYDSNIGPDKELSEAEQQKQAQEIMDALGGEKLADEKIMGYTCEVYTVMGSKVWFYKGISLKSTISLLGINAEENAIVFKPNISIPDSKFTPPSDVQYTEIIAEEMQQTEEVYEEEVPTATITSTTPEKTETIETSEKVSINDKYSYTKFEDALNNFSFEKYKKVTVRTNDNYYIGIYNSGLLKNITIYAKSPENASEYKNKVGFLSFKHGDKQCYYGKTSEAASTTLVVEFPSYNITFIIISTPFMSKSKMLEVLDALKF